MDKIRFYNLDILKLVSAILIVFHHYQQLTNIRFNFINFYGGIIPFGFIVELFFMISGFLMAMTYKRDGKLFGKIGKRLLRLMPMASISVIVCLIIEFIYKVKMGNTLLWDRWYSFAQIITSILMIGNGWFVEYSPLVNNPIWYLCILIVLTVLFVFINESVKSKKLNAVLYIMIVCAGLVGFKLQMNIPFLYLSNCRGYASFFIGVLLFEEVYARFVPDTIVISSVLSLIVSFMIILAVGKAHWYIFILMIFPAVVALSIGLPQIKNKHLEIWGGISFEIYLWHVPLYCLMKLVLDINHIVVQHTYLTMVGFLVITCGVAVVQYFVVEQSINRVIRGFKG